MTDEQTHTKEAEFKRRFASVLQDLQRDGVADAEAMAMIGSLANDIANSLKQTSWSGAKSALTAAGYDELLNSFQRNGGAAQQGGQHKQAYAVQVLAFSLVAGTQRRDAAIAEGEKLLDALIDHAAAVARKVQPRRTN
ncbi:hypothetical protein [Devosia rhizoryzae]|uniref:Uncharacterized protein n=1 Tax=Devosia rhizoryzae TaxID=2774137 RepID=A0ABX7CBK3_9HYPH|nr:hypothetical protein [Devosia rhizoryzae]QQR40137.1 hypothetical protein JI748_03750 [Devosia rhizoryzae]